MNFVFKLIYKFKCLLKYNFYLYVVLIGLLVMNLCIFKIGIFILFIKIDSYVY